jgi:Coenzyme PQQ synthesis protein D (PqqD)
VPVTPTAGRITTVRRNPRVVYRSLLEGQGGVLLQLDTGAYHGVNHTGSLIWELLDTEHSLTALLVELRVRLETVPETFDAEIEAFLNDLTERDLLLVTTEPGQP